MARMFQEHHMYGTLVYNVLKRTNQFASHMSYVKDKLTHKLKDIQTGELWPTNVHFRNCV